MDENLARQVCVCVRQQFALVQKSSARFSFTSCLYLILKSSVKLWTESRIEQVGFNEPGIWSHFGEVNRKNEEVRHAVLEALLRRQLHEFYDEYVCLSQVQRSLL